MNFYKSFEKIGLFLLALVWATLLSHQVAAQDATPTLAGEPALQAFHSKGGGFSVQIPGTPQLSAQAVTTDAGPVSLFMYISQTPSAVYMIGYSDYPSDVVKESNQDHLKGARDGAIKNTNSTLLTDTPISLNGVEGRAFTAETPTMFLDAHIYYRNYRLYQLVVVHDKKSVAKNRDVFMNSFKIIP
jgi:hypothetical protein